MLEILNIEFPKAEAQLIPDISPECIHINHNFLVPVCQFLHQNEELYFDMLTCITAIDNGPEEGQMEIAYNLNSIPNNKQLTLKISLTRNEKDLVVDTVSGIWKTAIWHEREVYDLMGIKFKDHPDLRRIFLPADWTGHPLRKDYEDLETYHGIIVK